MDIVPSTQRPQILFTPKTWCSSLSIPRGKKRWRRSWRSLVSLLCRWWRFGMVTVGKRSLWGAKMISLLFWLATASDRVGFFAWFLLWFFYLCTLWVKGAGVVIAFLAGICTFRNGVLCLNDYFLSYGQNWWLFHVTIAQWLAIKKT